MIALIDRRKVYPTDLTDEEWDRVTALVPTERPGGRPRSVDTREIINAILYMRRSSCSWRMLPHDLPPWATVYSYFMRWQNDGTLCRILNTLGR